MERIVVIGSSGHAKVVIDILNKNESIIIVGLIDCFAEKGKKILGYEVLGKITDLPLIMEEKNVSGGIIAIGDNWSRYQVYHRILTIIPNYRFYSAIHPSAQIGAEVAIGTGSVVMAGAVINSCCVIGKFCIINTKASLDHDSYMKDFASLAPGVVTGGFVTIDEFSAILIGVVIKDRISIGKHTVIGGGSFVNKNIDDNVVAYGIPVKQIASRKNDDKYL